MIILQLRKICSSFVTSARKRFKVTASCVDIGGMKVFAQKRNPITGATEWDMQHEDYDFHQEIARSAFADMLHDKERNEKYYLALQMAVDNMHAAGKKANVLDIGTGTGLLSIMAVKCGADSVVACEAFKPMADCCLKVLARNNVSDKITVIPKRSTDLTVGEDGDLKQKANILVTEVFDTELIGEGALSTFRHAHQFLLEKDCIVIPDSAVVYAQVVECSHLTKWNKLNDLTDEDVEVLLKVPEKIKMCPGHAAVHDIQLSQLPRHAYVEISEQIPVFYYDWSGRSPIDLKRTVKQKFEALCNEEAQVVFVWWELNMDNEGRIVLSCAPWWGHPNANVACQNPENTIPWRDHWMQGVYYLPKPVNTTQFTELTLVCCQDEYSLWFYLEDEDTNLGSYPRPVCECGAHMAFSRTHLSYLNDRTRSNKFVNRLTEELRDNKDRIVLDLNGSSFYGLAAAKLGAKKVYILESMNLNIQILNDFIAENEITNVEFISEVTDELLRQVSLVVGDPSFSSAVLPWENLKVAYLLHEYKDKLSKDVVIIPEKCTFWAMPVEFQNLQKIRIPLGSCEGIDVTPFDELVEKSREISDGDLEAQPLWEYPCTCRGEPRQLLEIDLRSLSRTYANNETHPLSATEMVDQSINAFVLWSMWTVGGKPLSYGPTWWPGVGEALAWYPYTRQAVRILKESRTLKYSDQWSFQVACDLEKGQFDVKLDLSPAAAPATSES